MRFAVVLLVLSLLLATGCSKNGEARATSQTAPDQAVAVRTAAVQVRQLGQSVSVTGSLQPDETVSVSSEVGGRLAQVRYDFGQSVREGAIIAELDKRELLIQRDRANAALAQALARVGLDASQEEVTPESTPMMRQAKAQMEDARSKYDRAARLVKTGDVSEERYVEIEKVLHAREAAYEATHDDLRTQLATIQALRADVRLANKRLADATVRAPFDGQVAARLVSPGQFMKENTPIVTLVKSFPLRLRVEIPESATEGIRPGTTLAFTTDAAPGATFHARVTELNPTLDARSRSLSAEARITDRDARLRPGTFVQVQLALARDVSVTLVPKDAIYQIAGLTKIFTVRDGRAKEHKLARGRDMDGLVEVPGGELHAGDEVAVTKVPILTDGAPVRIER